MGDWYEQPDGSWAYDENAPAPATDPTGLLPMVSPVEVLHGDGEPTGDVGDWIDPNAPDPTPDEIADPSHPDYVEPWRPA